MTNEISSQVNNSKPQSRGASPNVNKKNEELVVNKILKEISYVLARLKIDSPRINYLEMSEIMAAM